MTLERFQVRSKADNARGWTIPLAADGGKRFAIRMDAFAFAAALARSERAMGGISYLCIEGGDGQWRQFTSDLMPVQ